MEFLKIKHFTGRVFSIIGVFLSLVILILLLGGLKPVEVVRIAGARSVDTVYVKTPVKIEKRIEFCDELVLPEKVDYLLEFIASTESQGHQFNPSDKAVREKAFKVKNKTSTALGKWQMLRQARESTAKYLGEKAPTDAKFAADSSLQKKYIVAFFEMCNDKLQNYTLTDKRGNLMRDSLGNVITYNVYEKYVNRGVINGYVISKSGILAVSHAIGVKGTVDWFETGCNPKKLPKGAPIADRRLTCQIF